MRRITSAAVRQVGETVPLLFTPGPLTTTDTVKGAMLKDYGSRDQKFIQSVKEVRSGILVGAAITGKQKEDYTMIPMQGSGSMGVEAIIGSMNPREGGRHLVVINGTYGERIGAITQHLGIDFLPHRTQEDRTPDLESLEELLKKEGSSLTMLSVVHCETTTGIFNPLPEVAELRRRYCPQAVFFVDAMSSFGATEIDMPALDIDVLCTSSNKCIQGVPGFSVLVVNRASLAKLPEQSCPSYTLSLHRQLKGLDSNGQFPNTPPVHSLIAFHQALEEWKEEGGVKGRMARYQSNRDILVDGMKALGFKTYLEEGKPSFGHIILTFVAPIENPNWDFVQFYSRLSERGYVIYPGKQTKVDTFRLGCIGDLHEGDMKGVISTIEQVMADMDLVL